MNGRKRLGIRAQAPRIATLAAVREQSLIAAHTATVHGPDTKVRALSF